MNANPLNDGAREHLNQISEKIIGAAYTVLNDLGCGFLEKVYENALSHELRKQGMIAMQQPELLVHYDGVVVGVYRPDILVGSSIIVDVKTVKAIGDAELAQVLNYLKATGLRVALVLNFSKPKLEIKRVVRNF